MLLVGPEVWRGVTVMVRAAAEGAAEGRDHPPAAPGGEVIVDDRVNDRVEDRVEDQISASGAGVGDTGSGGSTGDVFVALAEDLTEVMIVPERPAETSPRQSCATHWPMLALRGQCSPAPMLEPPPV